MIVIEYESTSQDIKHSFCYSTPKDILQVNKEVINNLDSAVMNRDIKVFTYFEDEMEKINFGDTSNIAAVKLNEYLGTIGLPNESEKISKRRKIYGIC